MNDNGRLTHFEQALHDNLVTLNHRLGRPKDAAFRAITSSAGTLGRETVYFPIDFPGSRYCTYLEDILKLDLSGFISITQRTALNESLDFHLLL